MGLTLQEAKGFGVYDETGFQGPGGLLSGGGGGGGVATGTSSPSKGLTIQQIKGFGVYDSGGYLPMGLSLAYNGTGSPEAVGAAAGGSTVINFNGPVYGDKRKVALEIYDELAEIDRQRTGSQILGGGAVIR
jgi:hypothetical protein